MIFVTIAFIAFGFIAHNTFAGPLDPPGLPTDDGGGYSCTVTSTCGSYGSVSCTGQTCERGWQWVECDGKRTDC